jgi:G:T/U-mismatch repair DNA glycosylase
VDSSIYLLFSFVSSLILALPISHSHVSLILCCYFSPSLSLVSFSVFWWIAGDCLGFRRHDGISNISGKQYWFVPHLRYHTDYTISYPQQVLKFTTAGFALWDIVQSCTRPGSLDTDITNELPNDIPHWCHHHKNQDSIQRIVISNGHTAAKMFLQFFHSWILDIHHEFDFVAASHPLSQRAFRSILQQRHQRKVLQQQQQHQQQVTQGNVDEGVNNKDINMNHTTKSNFSSLSSSSSLSLSTCESKKRTIELVVAISPSPAAASRSYLEKRDLWKGMCISQVCYVRML